MIHANINKFMQLAENKSLSEDGKWRPSVAPPYHEYAEGVYDGRPRYTCKWCGCIKR